MADVPNGGRIVPIVATARQHYSGSSTNEVMDKAHQQPSEKLKASRNSRSKIMEAETLEIPCLNELGLYALPTEGDGNCLYYALSDQLYGDFAHADQIRDRLADHISANKDYFMSFIAAAGGERRAPRRAAAAAARQSYCSSSSASPAPPSAKDKERSFDSKVAESRKKGVWGGAEEIQAFCQSFKKDVNVYTMYGIQNFRDVHAPEAEEREIVHIAFHDFHHYSSVRHGDGPHTGLPCIPKADKEQEKEASAAQPTIVDMATPWKISAIQAGLGGNFDQSAIVEMLQQCRGNIDRAFMNLLGEDNNASLADAPSSKAIMKSRLQPSSRSSSPFSTGSKRSADESDTDDNPRPAVRRTRARENKRRILPDVTVGIAFRDDQNDLVSLRLRVSPETVVQTPTVHPSTEQAETSSFESATDSPDIVAQDRKLKVRPKAASSETSSQPNESSDDKKPPRRSQRLSRSRTAPRSS
ncbi:OTU domain-containing protein [Aspergillus ibericus CBS 121593]|uniref:OTU-like cysteine protease n=1 Tax=Aspergillus ibericus CBS 121593 TaxID=1448316 RepID=A0A395HIQ2_9EURO|nr:OTU-like cysteine protease [Aspergillus ibericus CBS 121593]RAL06144.1 OTU-like cysteine protease [Aspergillus ibericus CBS 121593]